MWHQNKDNRLVESDQASASRSHLFGSADDLVDGDEGQDTAEYVNPVIELTTMTSPSRGLPSIPESPLMVNGSTDDDMTATFDDGGLNIARSKFGLQTTMTTTTTTATKNTGIRPDRSRRVLTNSKFDFHQKKTLSLLNRVDGAVIEPKPANFMHGNAPVIDPIIEVEDKSGYQGVRKGNGSAHKDSFFGNVKTKLKTPKGHKQRRVYSPVLVVNLVEAVRRGDMENMKNLLTENSSFNLNKLDKSNLALLHHAAIHNRDFIARELIRRGANVDVLNLDIKATPLHGAARMNSTDVAHVLLARCADVDRKTTTGLTPLHISARRGNEEMTKILITLGRADVQVRDSEKGTALHLGAMSGNIGVCKLLIENGADIRAKDANNMTPLMRAVMSGHVDLVDLLLERGKYRPEKTGIEIRDYIMDEDNESNTCLHLAVVKRRTEVIQRLFDHFVDVNVVKKNGMSPLHIAAINGSTVTAMQLIENGADIELKDNEGMTPLHRAALNNRVESIALLLHEGAPIDEVDNSGFTPLLCAAWKGHKPAGELLLSRGANIHVFDIHHKSTLHWAAEMDHLGFVDFLLKNGGYDLLNSPDIYDQTALHYAADTGNVEMIKLLINFEVKGEVRDVLEKTPVHVAAQAGYVGCVEELVRQTPLLLNEDDKDGMTPLLTSCYYGHHDLVKALIKMGADITSVNDDNRTALMLAASNNHVETMSILIENNCDIHALDKNKNSALHLCCDAGHIAAANLLIRAGADQSCSNDEGFTPLELAIEREQEEIAAAIIKSKDWRIAMQSKDEQMISPLKALIEKLPDVALLVMDRCVHKTYKDAHSNTYDIKYEYQYVDPGPDDESTKHNGYRYFAMRTMCQYGREKLLAHELSQHILKRKWVRFGRIFFYIDVFLYLVFLTCLTSYSVVSPVYYDGGYWDYVNQELVSCPIYNFTAVPELRDYMWYHERSDSYWYIDQTSAYIGYAVFTYCICMIVGELCEIYTLRLQYFTDLGNLIDWAMLSTSILFVFPPGRIPCLYNWNAGVAALFCAWMKFILYFKGFQTTGLYVLMFIETLMSLIKAMTVFVMFVVAFTVTFNMLFNQMYRFSTMANAFMSTLTMMLGELNKDEIFNADTDLTPYAVTSYILYMLFIFLMPMVLNNLTIGLAVGDIEGIRKKAFIKRNSVQADYVYHLESKCPIWLQRFLYQSEYIMRVRKDHYRSKFVSLFFPPEDAALVEVDDKSEPRNAEHVLDELQRQKATLASLKLMVRQQGDILQRLAEKGGVGGKLQDIAALSELYKEQAANEDDEDDPTSSVA